VFLADFNVQLAEKIYPAADLSEQISTAGLEASGTGNMKFALNGALTIGTLDGANVEIREHVGAENFVLFGRTTDQIAELHSSGYRPWEWVAADPLLEQVFALIESGHFSGGDTELFKPLVQNLVGSDPYAVIADFAAYLEAQARVDAAWEQRRSWQRMSLLNTARCGFFSSDRAIREYASRIWQTPPARVEMSCPI